MVHKGGRVRSRLLTSVVLRSASDWYILAKEKKRRKRDQKRRLLSARVFTTRRQTKRGWSGW